MKIFGYCMISGSLADIFLHNPRGSNNKLNEQNDNRANGNRLFDSQNNGRGGYNVADKYAQAASSEDEQHKPVYFQSGLTGDSKLLVEWWSQHGCGSKTDKNDPNWIDCQYILQYSCQRASQSTFRNGNDTTTPNYTKYKNANGDVIRDNIESYEEKISRKAADLENSQSGLHESWEYYDACWQRERNSGLFIADKSRDKWQGATKTRQNAGGQRRGYECPEERDFYPYWHPTPWTDIAVLTSAPEHCDYYEAESQNRKGKHECVEIYPESDPPIRKHRSRANNEYHCNEVGGTWTEFFNAHEIIPVKREAECEAKALEIGKTFGEDVVYGFPYQTGEKSHEMPQKRCILLPPKVDCKKAPWQRANHLGNTIDGNLPRYEWTLPHFHFDNEPRECIFRIRYNISTNDYPDQFMNENSETYFPYQHLNQNPKVEVMDGLSLQLAINTAQFGRTFQDRTHIFSLEKRPKNVPDEANLLNLGVRGRRGNIQQSFVAVEYDFIPNDLEITEKDYIHIQWEGSNTLSANANGEGTAGTDRHNMVALGASNWNIPIGKLEGNDQLTFEIEYPEETKKFEYRLENGGYAVNYHDAKKLCENYGMTLPEPADEIMNEALAALNRKPDGSWQGDFFLGIRGNYHLEQTDSRVEFEFWRGKGVSHGAKDRFALMVGDGTWEHMNTFYNTNRVFCIKPFEEREEPNMVGLFDEATWVWSSLDVNHKNSQDLQAQMASSGYYHCADKAHCGFAINSENIEPLQAQLNNAPASFHGNILRFNKGVYQYMCTRNNNFSNRAQKGAIIVN